MTNPHILVVDDEKLIRWSLVEFLKGEGFQVSQAADAGGVWAHLRENEFDLILLDYKLPDEDGISMLRRIATEHRETLVVMMTSHSSIENAVLAMQAGAYDYITKPFRNEDMLLRVNRALETTRLQREVRYHRSLSAREFGFGRIVGRSPQMMRVLDLVRRIIHTPDTTILIQGESGTGKDVLAKVIHYGGSRQSGPMMNITCTALPEALLESELFGHERGAFTDAKQQKKGLLELAAGGTVYLDEIGDMTLYLQSKLLRFLEEKSFRRVGGTRDIRVDVRVIAATNKDLRRMVADGRFREDLYYRLKVIPIHLPPLRERAGDIPLLVDAFVDQYNKEFRKQIKGLDAEAMGIMEEYHWPGNIRELRNTIERAMILSTTEILGSDDLPVEFFEDLRREERPSRLKLPREGINIEDLEIDLVRQALELTRGNQTRAGKLLGLNRDQIRYRIEKYRLNSPDGASRRKQG